MGPFPLLIQPITANVNDLHMQLLLLVVVRSAALIPRVHNGYRNSYSEIWKIKCNFNNYCSFTCGRLSIVNLTIYSCQRN